eukprot:TRINITY_DN39893_c0_g1_i1.p1 TRINITY_DN39893_c0_g1~~TRINITY_DN39893_c0_g1_i1.p1  ORF type:complete len:642 (-),score=136.33 TRINITY_DN39893_c0_g1_i1:55-1815(-)
MSMMGGKGGHWDSWGGPWNWQNLQNRRHGRKHGRRNKKKMTEDEDESEDESSLSEEESEAAKDVVSLIPAETDPLSCLSELPPVEEEREIVTLQASQTIEPGLACPEGGHQILVNIPRPFSSAGSVRDLELGVRVQEYGVDLILPEWYAEAREDLLGPSPQWPPKFEDQKENFVQSPSSAANAHTGADVEDEDDEGSEWHDGALDETGQQEMEEQIDPASQARRRRLYKFFMVALCSVTLERAAQQTIKEWAKMMQTHFEDTCQTQMRISISWLARALRTFGQTLIADSQKGLDLSPLHGSKFFDDTELTLRQRLFIRTRVIFDILKSEIEAAPPALVKFLSELCQLEGVMVYIPKHYFTKHERRLLGYTDPGGIFCLHGSIEHQRVIAGFLLSRALLGGLFGSWRRALAMNDDRGTAKGIQNLQAIGALIYLALRKEYDLLSSVREVPGLSWATSEDPQSLKIDEKLVADVAVMVRDLVLSFVDPVRRVPRDSFAEEAAFHAGEIIVEGSEHDKRKSRRRSSLLGSLSGSAPPIASAAPQHQSRFEGGSDEERASLVGRISSVIARNTGGGAVRASIIGTQDRDG